MEDVRRITHALAGSSSSISVLCDASTLAAGSLLALALAAGVFIAFTVLASALSAGNLQAIQASLFEPKQRRHGTVFLQQTDLVYLHS